MQDGYYIHWKSAALSPRQYGSNLLHYINKINMISNMAEEDIQKLPNIAENRKRTQTVGIRTCPSASTKRRLPIVEPTATRSISSPRTRPARVRLAVADA